MYKEPNCKVFQFLAIPGTKPRAASKHVHCMPNPQTNDAIPNVVYAIVGAEEMAWCESAY